MPFAHVVPPFVWANPYAAGVVPLSGSDPATAGMLDSDMSGQTWMTGFRPPQLIVTYTCSAYTEPLSLRIFLGSYPATDIPDQYYPLVQDGGAHDIVIPTAALTQDITWLNLWAVTVGGGTLVGGVVSLTNIRFGASLFWAEEVLCQET